MDNKPIIRVHTQLQGEFRLVLRNSDESIAHDTGWMRNLIVDTGLDAYGGLSSSNSCLNLIGIGTDSSAPSNSDTALGGQLAQASIPYGGYYTNAVHAGAPNYEASKTVSARFNAGVGTGTIAEVGVFQTSTIMFARHAGFASFTKGIDQVLDVYYKLTVFPNTSDVNAAVTIYGTVFDTVTRAAYIGSFNGGAPLEGPVKAGSGSSGYNRGYDVTSTLGAITGAPSNTGNGDNTGLNTVAGYTAGDYYKDIQIAVGLNGWNVTGGVRCALVGAWPHCLQTSFTAQGTGDPLPKDETRTMQLYWRLSWARRP